MNKTTQTGTFDTYRSPIERTASTYKSHELAHMCCELRLVRPYARRPLWFNTITIAVRRHTVVNWNRASAESHDELYFEIIYFSCKTNTS